MSDPTRNALDVILFELTPLEGKSLLDIGCGKGSLRKPLEKAGALWHGLDPIAACHNLPIDIARAEAMPYDDGAYDTAVCVNALHHVPVSAMDAALSEMARVLRRDGLIVVIEPKSTGALSQVIAVVDDEADIRRAAQDAMDRTTALVEVTAYEYMRIERYADFDAFCETLIAVDPARKDQIIARQMELCCSFEHHAACEPRGWNLSQPMGVRIFQPA